MRQEPWPGMRQDTSDLGSDNLTDILNINMRLPNELRDRPALGTRYTLTATRLTALETTTATYLVSEYGGYLKSCRIDTQVGVTLTSGLQPLGCFATCLGAVYYANGTDPVQVIYDPSDAAYAAGIAAPSAAPTVGSPSSGSVTAGDHLIRYRYKNSVTGYLSDPSDATLYTAAGSHDIPLTLTSTSDAKVDKIVVEMTQAAGSVYYVVATITLATSYTIDMDDDTLGVQQLADVFAAPDGFGHDVPPASMTVIAEHKNRLFGIAGDTLYWSRASFPEGWDVLDWAKKVFTSGGDRPIALGSFFGDLYIFGSQGMARLSYTTDPAIGDWIQMPTQLGVWNQRCVVSVEGSLFGFGRQGVFVIDAIQPKLISQPVQDTIATDVDQDNAAATAFAFFDPQERVVWFMYRSVDDTTVRNAIALDLQTGRWSRRSFRHYITSACTASTSTTGSYAYLADGDGLYCWRLEANTFDGVSSLTSGVLTVTAGSTTTSINVSQSLPTSPSIVGAILYNPTTGEEKRITANTANNITCGAFADAPANGTELYVGSIQQTIKSGHVPVHYVNPGRRPEIFNIEHLSVAAATGVVVDVKYYLDYGTTPLNWTGAQDPQTTGLTIFSNYATQNLDSGRAMLPVPADYMLTIQWELTRTRPDGHMRLLDCKFDWNDQRAQDVPH